MMKRVVTVSSIALVVSLLTIALSVMPVGPVGAQSSNARSTLFNDGPTGAGASGNCAGVGVDTTTPSGFVNAHYNPVQNRLIINIHLEGALPNRVYFPSIRCLVILPPLTTDANGEADAVYKISLPLGPGADGVSVPGTFSVGLGTFPGDGPPGPVADESHFTGPITLP